MALAITFAAARDGSVAQAGPISRDVSATGALRFVPDELTAPANTNFSVTLTTTGGTHTFHIDAPGNPTAGTSSGGPIVGNFNLPVGVYEFYCNISGHRASGMVGTITITDSTPPPPPPPPVPPPPPPPPPPRPPEPPAADEGETETKRATSVESAKLVRVRGKRLRAQVGEGCSGGAGGPCNVTLLLTSSDNSRLLAAGSARRTVALAKKQLTVPAGAKRTATIALTKPGRKIFLNTSALRRVKVVVRASDENGKLPTTTKTVRLKVPKGV